MYSFATLPEWLALETARTLDIAPGARLLDPCCGDGTAIARMGGVALGLPVEAYGIEDDLDLVTKAEDHGVKALYGDALSEARATVGGFGLLYVFPPELSWSDWRKSHRPYPLRFLHAVAPWLARGGVGIFVLADRSAEMAGAWLGEYFERVEAKAASFDSTHFRLIRGVRRAKRTTERREIEREAAAVKECRGWGRDRYAVPAPAAGDLEFRSERLRPEEMLALARAGGSWATMRRATGGQEVSGEDGMPPLPLRKGHLALQMAAGHLDGVFGAGEYRHVLKGRVIRNRSYDADENVEYERFDVSLTAVTPRGEFVTIAGGGTDVNRAADQRTA